VVSGKPLFIKRGDDCHPAVPSVRLLLFQKELQKMARGESTVIISAAIFAGIQSDRKDVGKHERCLRNNLKDIHSVDAGIYKYFKIIDN
jgi:hypothetical protein